jgi:segregation and condensation protein A
LVTSDDAALDAGSLQGLPVKLELFEGPLDLLLHLIRENKVEITDIPISSITEQYLGYLELMKSLSLDVAGEFLVMAATLLHIKSRLLLPVDEEEEGEEGEDPRAELVRQLQEYQVYREAGEVLKELEASRRRVFPRSSIGPEEPKRTDFPLEVSMFEMLSALKKLLEKLPEDEPLEIVRDRLTVVDRINTVLDVLRGAEGELAFEELFRESRSVRDVIVTFLALLEIVRLRLARARQPVAGGQIMIAALQAADGYETGEGELDEEPGGSAGGEETWQS